VLALAVVVAVAGPVRAQDTASQVAALYRESYQLEANRDAQGALGKMREIKAKAGNSYFVAVRSAWLAYLVGDFAGSEASYRDAAALAPKAIEPRIGLTLPLLAQKKWRDLERACRDAMTFDANHATARARLAHALYSVGNFPDSATLYRKLVEDFPAELDYQTGLGWALLKMGRRAEARQLFAGVLAVSPDNVNAKQGMAVP
jgi:tetratricopeptide (TPR) repeat protein